MKATHFLFGALAGPILAGAIGLAGEFDGLAQSKHIAPFPKRGWRWTERSDAVTPDCGKRNPLFYVGEPVTFTLGPSALTYEVRDYWGNMVDQGPAGNSITVNVKQPGWYKLYVYGKPADRNTEKQEREKKKFPKGPAAPDEATVGGILGAEHVAGLDQGDNPDSLAWWKESPRRTRAPGATWWAAPRS